VAHRVRLLQAAAATMGRRPPAPPARVRVLVRLLARLRADVAREVVLQDLLRDRRRELSPTAASVLDQHGERDRRRLDGRERR